MKALKKLENWYTFGIILGVPYFQLRKIELNHQKDIDRCKAEMLQYWLDSTLVTSWNEVILALEVIDQLALAAEIKHDYYWSSTSTAATIATEKEGMYHHGCIRVLSCLIDIPLLLDDMFESTSKRSATLSASTVPASVTTEESNPEIEADVAVVSNLKELEASFGLMIVRVKRHLEKCSLSEAKLFLCSTIGSTAFSDCENFETLLQQLQQNHIDVFNISLLKKLLANFETDKSTDEVIEAYNKELENFLKQTKVLEFQRAVVSRVEPILASGMAVVTITISKDASYDRTLMDIQKLAKIGFKECHKKFIRLKAKLGSIIISWVFPKELTGMLKQLACDNAAVFKDSGVVEVTVGGKIVFPCTQQKVILPYSWK